MATLRKTAVSVNFGKIELLYVPTFGHTATNITQKLTSVWFSKIINIT